MSDKALKKLRVENHLSQPIYIRRGIKIVGSQILLLFEFHDRHPGTKGRVKVLPPCRTMAIIYKPSAKLRFAVCLNRETYRRSRPTDYGWLYYFIGYRQGAN